MSDTIIAQYEPFKDPESGAYVEPMYIGVLVEGQLTTRDVTAALVYYAASGYIEVKRIESVLFGSYAAYDFEIRLLKVPATGIEHTFLEKTLELFFTQMNVGDVCTLSEVYRNPQRKLENYYIFQSLQKSAAAYSIQNGYLGSQSNLYAYRHTYRTLDVCIATLAMYVLATSLVQVIQEFSFLVIAVAIVHIVYSYTVSSFSVKMTQKGLTARSYLLGFKDFLSTTETDRVARLANPTQNPDLFYQYLPYAIAFGVEKKWSNVFETSGLSKPSWVVGSSMDIRDILAVMQTLDLVISDIAQVAQQLLKTTVSPVQADVR